ncbi:MAG: GTP-binding protein [Cellulosilyticum sp.]|nr:GTP-binding protein [Cellulosilyticum sp.]
MKGLLKFITCGSVDDGKSTLIGHILYDSKLLYADQERALELDSKVGSREGEIDYSLLLDGLMAEREQGITIDVAYRYFTTNNRSFIVADTPGHEEYTRNMAVGASFADLAIILVDAKQGVLIQTKRHARICTLMGIRNIVFAINKMDLVNYSEEIFKEIESQISDLTTELEIKNVTLIPVSATEGDNVTTPSKNTKWYSGKALLPYLEEVDIHEDEDEKGFYMPVQRVCRPNHEFRGFQGQVEAGSVSVGDEITSLPSNETAHVKSIYVGDDQVHKAHKGQPVTIQLDREVDVSRGCVLSIHSDVKITSSITATILWMDDSPLNNGKSFLIKVGTKMIPGMVTEIVHTIDVNTGKEYNTDRLNKNEIAVCKIDFTDKIVTDEFTKHKTLGELILIDRITNMTSACGVVNYVNTTEKGLLLDEKITKEVRARLNGQYPVIVEFPIGRNGITTDFVQKVEQQLSIEGKHTYLYQPQKDEPVEVVCKHLNNAGLIVLLAVDEVFVDKDILKDDSIYYRNWQANDKLTVDEAVQYIKKISAYSVE